ARIAARTAERSGTDLSQSTEGLHYGWRVARPERREGRGKLARPASGSPRPCGGEGIRVRGHSTPFEASRRATRETQTAVAGVSDPGHSAAGETGGGRTHTFGVRQAGCKLKTCAVYQRSDIVLSHGKPIPRNGNGEGQH